MIKYTAADIKAFTRLGRKKFMKSCFGGEYPDFWEIISGTLEQIHIVQPDHMEFIKEGETLIFRSDKDWISNIQDLLRMLEGVIRPCVALGANATRIETSFRYLFEEVYFGFGNDVKCYQGEGKLDLGHYLQDNMYTLILTNFGKYNWDEEMS